MTFILKVKATHQILTNCQSQGRGHFQFECVLFCNLPLMNLHQHYDVTLCIQTCIQCIIKLCRRFSVELWAALPPNIYQGCLNSEQPWMIEIVYPSEAKGRLLTAYHKGFGFVTRRFLTHSVVYCGWLCGSTALCETRLRQPAQENDDTLPIIARNLWSKTLMPSASICETLAGKPVPDTLQGK